MARKAKTCPVCGVAYVEVRRGGRNGPLVQKCPEVKVHNYVTYRNHNCRCGRCTKGNSEYQAQRRAERRERVRKGDPAVPHGQPHTAYNWGCSCAKCLAAARESGG